MPRIEVRGLDDLTFMLNRVTDKSEEVVKRAIYDGVGIIADDVRGNIGGIRTGGPSDWERRRREEQKAGLQEGLTTYQIEDNGGKIEGGVGFTGYNSRGQANQMIARVFNSGTSFSSKQPFFDRAVRSSRNAARQTVVSEIESEISKLTKG